MGIRNEHCGPGAEITPHSKTLPSTPNGLLNHIACWVPTHLPYSPLPSMGPSALWWLLQNLLANCQSWRAIGLLWVPPKKKIKATLCRPHPSACPVAPLAPCGSDQSSGACCQTQAGSPLQQLTCGNMSLPGLEKMRKLETVSFLCLELSNSGDLKRHMHKISTQLLGTERQDLSHQK